MRIAHLLLALLLALLFFGIAQADGPYDLIPELVTNQDIPGVPGRLTGWWNAKTNADGDILFDGRMQLGPGGETRSGIFLKHDGAIRKVLLVGDDLPDGAGKVSGGLMMAQLGENGAVAIVHPSQGVLLYHESGLRWLVRKGADVPGTSLSVEYFRGVAGLPQNYMRPLVLEGNRVIFQAELSDSSTGLFVAAENGLHPVLLGGGTVPGRTTTLNPQSFFWDAEAAGGALVFNTFEGTFLFHGVSVKTVALPGDTIPGGYVIQAIDEVDVNSQGLVILAARLQKDSQSESQIVFWSAAGGFRTIVDKNSTFPGPHSGTPGFFTHLALTETGSFCFVTRFGNVSGIYVFEGDKITKVAADGDPTPLGGGFLLEIPLFLIPGPPPPNRIFYDVVATPELDIAFTANVLGTDQGRAAFLWSSGSLAPIPVKDQAIEGLDSQRIDNLEIANLATGPRLLLSATCYANWTSALVSAVPAQPRHSYLPLVAWGNAGDLGYYTQLSLTNRSRFPGNVGLEWFSRSGQQIHGTGFPELMSLEPGQVRRLHPSPYYGLPFTPAVVPMQTGYVKLTVEGGARISADVALELRDWTQAISRASIAAAQPSKLADLPIDAGTGKTAVAITNSGNSPVRAVIELRDDAGQPVGTETIDFAARRQSNFMLEDFFGTLPSSFRGGLRVQSNAPVLTASLRLHGVESSSLPVFQQPQHRVRKWGYENIHPGSVDQSLMSPAGIFAYVADGKLHVLKGGRLYFPLESEEAQSKISPGSYAQLIGFWRDDELLFEAHQSTSTTAIFSWKPGRLERLFGVPEGLPGGQEFRIASFNEGSEPRKFAIGIGGNELFLLGSERRSDNSTELVFYRYDGQLHRSAVLSTVATSSSFPSVKAFECRAPYVAFVVGSSSYSQLWLYSDGDLRMLTDTENSAPQYSRVLTFRDIRLTSQGQVFFAGELESRMTLERRSGFFRFDQDDRVTPVFTDGDPIPGLPGIAADLFDLYSSNKVFEINANDRVVLKVHAGGGTVFLEAADTTAAPALFFPTAEAFQAGERQRINEFEWTDDDSLVFVGYFNLQESLRVWRDGQVETVFDNAESLSTFRNQPPSVIDSIRKLWASSSGHIFFDAHTAGGEPPGIWQVLPGNARSYIFPSAPDIDENGIRYGSSMTLQNRDEQESRVRITLVDTEGREAASEELVLAAGESRTVATEHTDSFSGWARVSVQGGDTTVSERLTLELDGHFSQLHLEPATPLKEVYLLGTPGWSSDSSTDLIGVAIANPYSGAPEVFIERIGEGFEVVEQTMIVFPPRGQRAFYLSDLLPASPDVKTIRIRSTWPVAVTALNWSPLGICLQPVF